MKKKSDSYRKRFQILIGDKLLARQGKQEGHTLNIQYSQ
jgi:hypothetical protein